MTEEAVGQPVLGVAPVVPAVPRRVVGADAENALRERYLKARGEELVYSFRGKEYKLVTPMPAAFLVHSGQIQDGDDVDMREFVSAIRSAFIGKDGDDFVAALMDTSAEIPADAEFISQVLSDIVEAVSGRPPTK
jgi:hypothetical protein